MGASTLGGKILEADNIFVATIEDMTTEYSDSIYDDENKLTSSIPETRFKLKLLENLRRDLPINTTIQAFRPYFGNGDGVEERKFITLIEDDIIPEKGKTYIFLTRVVDGELIVPSGGEAPSNFPLENAPMDLDKQRDEVIKEVVETSSKVEEVERQVRDEKQVYDKIGDTLLNGQEIQERINGQVKKPDLSKIVS
ncbi:hypothetical protein FACS1894193_12450 [Bacilli bacterium]|nr:hypothetical protein FACS1894193_12450 [Bacilli bacterium]